jgi:hypothetical protein
MFNKNKRFCEDVDKHMLVGQYITILCLLMIWVLVSNVMKLDVNVFSPIMELDCINWSDSASTSQNRVAGASSFKNPKSMNKWQIHIVFVLAFIKAMYLASMLDNANRLLLMTWLHYYEMRPNSLWVSLDFWVNLDIFTSWNYLTP